MCSCAMVPMAHMASPYGCLAAGSTQSYGRDVASARAWGRASESSGWNLPPGKGTFPCKAKFIYFLGELLLSPALMGRVKSSEGKPCPGSTPSTVIQDLCHHWALCLVLPVVPRKGDEEVFIHSMASPRGDGRQRR
jgi:hypothetical protein